MQVLIRDAINYREIWRSENWSADKAKNVYCKIVKNYKALNKPGYIIKLVPTGKQEEKWISTNISKTMN